MESMDAIALYRSMARARAFELALADLWHRGLVPGEMHVGTGEEGIAAGVVAHLREGDAVALDHRPTPVMFLRGVDPVALLKESMGREDGLCRGRGGHMHLFDPERLAASSGIVGSAGPAAAGFALAAKRRRPGSVAVAFFGDGAVNQGMLLESWNLAAAWSLPVLFVCKVNGWAITTRTAATTGGDLVARAQGFGLDAARVDGGDVGAVHDVAGRLVERARRNHPAFLAADCARLDGHLLGDMLLRMVDDPLAPESREVLGRVLDSATAAGGGGVVARAGALLKMMGSMAQAKLAGRSDRDDPLQRSRKALRGREAELDQIDREAADETARAVAQALGEAA